jgi:Cu(I)/Ag(I) efflux system membrane protein CusA/SilA
MIGALVEYCARHRLIVFAATAALALFGLYSLEHASLDALPDLSDRQVIVLTEWEGRSPDLVEAQITFPIVSKLVAAPKVKVVRGQSFFGTSFVYAIFEDGTDPYWARSRVLEHLDGLRGRLPEGASPILGPDASGVGWIYQYALVDESGTHDLQELRALQDLHLDYVIESVPGVAEVAPVGGFVKQYQVELDPTKLLAYQVSVEEIIHAIRRSNNDVGGRTIELGSTEYMVRGRGYVRSIEDLRSIVLRRSEGAAPILLGEVADVKVGAEPRRGLAELDGRGEVVGAIVVARDGENALDVIRRVEDRIEAYRSSLPPGVDIVEVYDRSDLIHRAIDSLSTALIEELLVVALFILVFLVHVRSALVPIISLPIAVVASFIPIYYFGLTINIMSLGGILIAVGAMVDASIIFVENAHKRLEEWEDGGQVGNRDRVLIDAFKEVGPSIFASLLVLTVSFIPIFALEAQEGRLFRPLAVGKTFAMLFAAVLAVTLVPALGRSLIRGRIRPERDNPVSRALHRLYDPVLRAVLRHERAVIVAGVLVTLSTIPIFTRLGSEFMPPLNEGSILYMPTSVAGISVTEAARVLQIQDRILKTFPEVTRVFGKIGRAQTATDPAPLSMAETTVLLRPHGEWRTKKIERWYSGLPEITRGLFRWAWPDERPLEWDELIAEMDAALQIPGMPPIWWMPVQTRIEMLSTGIRSSLGLKVFGDDREVIEGIGIQVEQVLRTVPGTRNAFAERITGGYYVDYEIDRMQAARYGLAIEDVEDIIETAIGGRTVARTVEGRESYGIVVQYLRGLRDNEDALERVLVPLPHEEKPKMPPGMSDGTPLRPAPHVPISVLTRIEFRTGPHMIQNEDGHPFGVVFVDIADDDYEGYVERARAAVSKIDLPPGYRIEWAGQYQSILRVRERLQLVIPLTLFIVFFILYMNFQSWRHTLIVLLAVPFSLVGAVWLVWALGFNLSVAVWVGMIALAGIDAETGVVMLLYLDLAYDKAVAEGRMTSRRDLDAAIYEGAVKRLRPKVMTVFTDVVGLMPVMWAASMETGADVTQRMAAPIVGGLVTSFILELTIYPAIYALWKGAGLPK